MWWGEIPLSLRTKIFSISSETFLENSAKSNVDIPTKNPGSPLPLVCNIDDRIPNYEIMTKFFLKDKRLFSAPLSI